MPRGESRQDSDLEFTTGDDRTPETNEVLFESSPVVTPDQLRCFKQFVRSNFDHFVALKVDCTQKVYNNSLYGNSRQKAQSQAATVKDLRERMKHRKAYSKAIKTTNNFINLNAGNF